MDWNRTYPQLRKMVGMHLKSITGKTDITLISIDPNQYLIEDKYGTRKRKTAELQKLVLKMTLNHPVHVDSELFGGGERRNQPETVLANLPEVEWIRIKRKKHIVWVGEKTHKHATLKERDNG